jgi:hypothetical protein
VKYVMIGLLAFISGSAFAESGSTLSDFLKKPDGSVDEVNFAVARKKCASQNLTVPTIRQLAEFAQKFGAQLKEVTQTSEAAAEAAGFTLVDSYNVNNTEDQFYYNGSKFVPPSGFLPASGLSQTLLANTGPYNGGEASFPPLIYVFSDNGTIYLDDYLVTSPARCFVP